MLNQLKTLLSRSPSSTPQLGPPCKHTYCTNLPYCVKNVGGEKLSPSKLSLASEAPQPTNPANPLDHIETERESEYDWDSDWGWHEFCHRCHRERCQNCEVRAPFRQLTKLGNTLTFETREVWICAPCKHGGGRCPGWRVVMISLCGKCGHKACEVCKVRVEEGKKAVCCVCAEKEKIEGKLQDEGVIEKEERAPPA